jgi:hypothetical protein
MFDRKNKTIELEILATTEKQNDDEKPEKNEGPEKEGEGKGEEEKVIIEILGHLSTNESEDESADKRGESKGENESKINEDSNKIFSSVYERCKP